jgi:hypothetical protein
MPSPRDDGDALRDDDDAARHATPRRDDADDDGELSSLPDADVLFASVLPCFPLSEIDRDDFDGGALPLVSC